MKKQLLFLVMMMLPLVASADAVEINGIYYNLITKAQQAEVTSNPNQYTGSIVIPESVNYNEVTYSVTSIGNKAFRDCSALTSIKMPNSVTSIGGEAFAYCIGLTSVTIPNSVTTIIFGAFAGCYSLTSINIPNSVTKIDDEIFSGCSSLTSITIPNSVTSIGGYAFLGCSGLTSITIPNSVTSIGDYAFSFCLGLSSITIPNSVTSIGYGAFAGCVGLSSINVDTNNNKYDSRENCNAIIETSTNTLITGCKNTNIPNSVTGIGRSAFEDCKSLTSIIIPNSVTIIDKDAFHNCAGLTSVTIGNGIQNINSFAFGECPYLTDVTCHAETVPNTANDAFMHSQIGQATLYVALASVNAYKAADPWKSFKSIVAIEDITDVNSNLNCTVDWNGSTASSITPWGINYARGVDLTINNYSDKDIKIAKIDAYINSSNIGSLPDVENTDIPAGTQKVFSFSISNSSAMPSTLPWLEIHYKIGAKTFVKDSRVPGTTSIHEINNEAEIIGIYDINGRKFNEPQKGINIVRYKDGSTKKVINK